MQDYLVNTAAGVQWQQIGIKPHHGIVVPLFSLHSCTSGGIGEYPDLMQLFPWCRSLGFDIIQLLPLNDTGLESSPYSALSANALNPIHLGLSQLSYAMDDPVLKKLWENLLPLNNAQRVSYPDVQKGKELFLREYYRLHGSDVQSLAEYQKFKEENDSWLPNYARFKSLKISTQWKPWKEWKEEDLKGVHDTEFHIFIQYLCFQQLERVKEEASKQNIFIKGDIPILINYESADVWSEQQLFDLEVVAGAPPDMYAPNGQKWGFPVYRWPAHEAQNYAWWIRRLKVAEHFYHLYRIDHIVGFFRIWGIPISKKGNEGYFIPTDEPVWTSHGEQIMRMMLQNCSLLPIGEDLGTVPPRVREALKSLGICGTKVIRWERRWNEDRRFIDPKDYPAESMTTVSTHDSETLSLWWRDQEEEAKLYADSRRWNYAPCLSPQQRIEILRSSHHSGSLFHVNLLQEYLALVPELIWPNLADERINIPGTISPFNWSYRFRPSVEEIVANASLKELVSSILR